MTICVQHALLSVRKYLRDRMSEHRGVRVRGSVREYERESE